MKRNLVTLALSLVLLLAICPPVSAAGPGPDPRFEAMLRAIELAPDRATLDAAFKDARERLLYVARDDARDTWSRLRAITMVGLYPDADVRAALTGLARHKDPEIRRRALYVVGRAFGPKGDEALVKLLVEALRDPVQDVRPMALRGLGWIEHRAATKVIERVAAGKDAKLAHLARYVVKRRAERKAKAGQTKASTPGG